MDNKNVLNEGSLTGTEAKTDIEIGSKAMRKPKKEAQDINALFYAAIDKGASDIHITVGSPVIARISNKLVPLSDYRLTPDDTDKIVSSILTKQQMERFIDEGEFDFSFSLAGKGRFRVNVYKQRGSYGMAFRIVPRTIPTLEQLRLPPIIEELTHHKRGLILVTGPTGSGKSTTLACMVDMINEREKVHIMTIEDPIEYLHNHKNSLVNQREVGQDSKSFGKALRASLRQDPDIILVGEMRDLETISTALTAAETGHLVLSTLHTLGADNTIDRVIDVFPPHQQQQVRVQFASVLQAVISQQLLPKPDGNGRVVALEVLTVTPAVRNMIREAKAHQLQTVIQTGKAHGMISMDASLINLYKGGLLSMDDTVKYSFDREYVRKQLDIFGLQK